MDGQNSLGMGGSGSENDEVFGGLSPLDFSYPESNSINLDLDANHLFDNPLGTTIPPSTDVLPDQTVVHEGGTSAVQDDEFSLSDQELILLNSLLFVDQEMPETGFSSFLSQEMNPLTALDLEISEISFSNFLSEEMNSLNGPNQALSGTNFLNFSTQELNSLSFSGQGLSMMDPFNFTTQELYLNTLELSDQGLSMMDTFGHPTQETLMNPLEFLNPVLPMSDTLGLPAHVSYLNSFEFPNQNLSTMSALSFSTQEFSMSNALSLPAPQLTSIGLLNHNSSINTSGVPYQSPPVFTTMTDNRGTTEIFMISSSDDEQLQEGFDPNYGNDNGASGSNSNLSLRQSLSKDMISQYFYLPIIDAATALNIGVTVLKSRCRELGFSRWPQRKLASIQTIITHLQEFGESSGIMIGGSVQERIIRLENERRRIEDSPDSSLEDDTLRLRQAIYKSSHKKRKRSDRDN